MPPIGCSGPNAANVIARNILYAQENALIVAAALVLSLVLLFFSKRVRAMPWMPIVLLATHPAWTISAVKGDCGSFKAVAATVYTAVAVVGLTIQIVAWIWPQRRSRAAPNPDDELPEYRESDNPYESPKVR